MFLFHSLFFCLLLRRPPDSPRTDTPFPSTALFRSQGAPLVGFAAAFNQFGILWALSNEAIAMTGGRLTKMLSFQGLKRVPIEEAAAGDIVADRKSTRLNSSH